MSKKNMKDALKESVGVIDSVNRVNGLMCKFLDEVEVVLKYLDKDDEAVTCEDIREIRKILKEVVN